MEAKDWPAIVVGLIAITAGIVMFAKRKWLARAMGDMQRALFGQLGKTISQNMTPGMIAFLAGGAVIMGSILITITVFRVLNHV